MKIKEIKPLNKDFILKCMVCNKDHATHIITARKLNLPSCGKCILLSENDIIDTQLDVMK